MDDEERSLWNRHRMAQTQSERDAARNAIAERYLHIARRAARRKANATPGCVEFDDLYSAACQAILQSIPRFDLERGVEPASFFAYRISGAMRDCIREADPVSRVHRIRWGKVERWEQTTLLRPATREEIVEQFGFDLRPPPRHESLHAGVDDGPALIDFVADHRYQPTADELNELSDLLRGCTQKERLLLLLYYVEGNTMAEIGQSLGLSESRVSQMLTSLLARLRARHESRPHKVAAAPERRLPVEAALRLLVTQPDEAVVAIDDRIGRLSQKLGFLKRMRSRLAA